jgi:hypothetical protein
MSDQNTDVADVLAQVVELGPTTRQATELGAAVSRHVSARPALEGGRADPGTVAALRTFGTAQIGALIVPEDLVISLSVVTDRTRAARVIDVLYEAVKTLTGEGIGVSLSVGISTAETEAEEPGS